MSARPALRRAGRAPLVAVLAAVALAAPAAVAVSPAVAAPEPARIAVVPVDTGTGETLLDVTFPDARHGFAVGENGTILATTDGGVTWSRQRSGVEISAEEAGARVAGQRAARQPVHLFGVSFATARQGWAVGKNTVLATDDGGATWAPLNLPSLSAIPGGGPGRLGQSEPGVDWDLRAVRFHDERRGIVVGTGGTVLVTDDGGRSWAWRGDRRFGDLLDLSFVDGAHGQAVGPSGGGVGQLSASIATADAGATWVLQEATGVGKDLTRTGFFAVATPAPARTYVVGDAGRIFVTVDGGQRWSVQRRDTTEKFMGIAFSGPARGVAVGLTEFTGTTRASLVATDDAGETWVGRLHGGDVLWDVAFASPDTAYAVGCGERVPAAEAISVVQAEDGVVTRIMPCRKSLLLRISFAGSPADAGGAATGGRAGAWWVAVIGGGAAVLVLAGAAAAGGQRRRSHR